MKEEKEEDKIKVEGEVVINEKDIINPEEVKEEETIEVEAEKVTIEGETEKTEEDKTEVVTSTGETKEEVEGESEEAPATKQEETEKEEKLVVKLNLYYDQVLKLDITNGKVIKDVYEANGVKLTKKRSEELIKAGVAELKIV